MKPDISIIVPVYKTEAYLGQCVESVLNQSFTNFELLLVDDGSPDNSGLICDEFAQKDSRVRVIHKTNGGVSSARNAGLKDCRGKYVFFLDSDDWIAAEALEKLMAVAEKHNADMVTFEFVREIFTPARSQMLRLGFSEDYFIDKQNQKTEIIYPLLLASSDLNEVWKRLYKYELIKDIFFDEQQLYAEDLLFSLIVYDRAETIYHLSEVLYHYRMTENSLTTKFFVGKYYFLNRLYQERRSYAVKWGMLDAQTDQTLLKYYLDGLFEITVQMLAAKNNIGFWEKVKIFRAIKKRDDLISLQRKLRTDSFKTLVIKVLLGQEPLSSMTACLLWARFSRLKATGNISL